MNIIKKTALGLGALLLAYTTGGCKSFSSHPDFARNLLTNRARVELEVGERDQGLEEKVRQSIGGKHAGAKFEVEAGQYIKNANDPDRKYQRTDVDLNSSFYVVLGNGQKLLAVGPNVELTDKFYNGNTSAERKTKVSAGLEAVSQGKNHQTVASVRALIPDTSRTEYTQDRVGDIKQGVIVELKHLQKLGYNVYLVAQGQVEHKVEDIERFGQDYATRHSTELGLGVGLLGYLNKNRSLFLNPNLSWQWANSNLSDHPSYQLRAGLMGGWKPHKDVTLGIEPYVEHNPAWKGRDVNFGAEASFSLRGPLHYLGKLFGVGNHKKRR